LFRENSAPTPSRREALRLVTRPEYRNQTPHPAFRHPREGPPGTPLRPLRMQLPYKLPTTRRAASVDKHLRNDIPNSSQRANFGRLRYFASSAATLRKGRGGTLILCLFSWVGHHV